LVSILKYLLTIAIKKFYQNNCLGEMMYSEEDKIIMKFKEQDFLLEGFEDILSKIRKDSRSRLRKLTIY